MITPYKNRSVDPTKKVELYRCLNRKGETYSVRQDGLVVGHTKKIVLKDCELVVNKAGKERCIKENKRNVHAFVRGTVGSWSDISKKHSYSLRYNPYSEMGFYVKKKFLATLRSRAHEIKKAYTVYVRDYGGIFTQI